MTPIPVAPPVWVASLPTFAALGFLALLIIAPMLKGLFRGVYAVIPAEQPTYRKAIQQRRARESCAQFPTKKAPATNRDFFA